MDISDVVTRHVCPRNCYSSCGILGYTRNGKLYKVEGDPKHGYTKGKLCPKGYHYVQVVYHPARLKSPMIQEHRGSGKWHPISWEKAISLIANKIIELYHRYGSHQSLALNKYSGNMGLLHLAVEGLFGSLGTTTRAVGSPCWSAGLDAVYYDFGQSRTSDLSDMTEADTIILWGANPVWTSIHALPYIYEAQKKGATLITIDPTYTATAEKSDLYIQVRPGSDGALAVALGKWIVAHGLHDESFLQHHTHGWPELKAYLAHVSMEEALAQCGQNMETIQALAQYLNKDRAVFIWTGFGLQRHIKGGQNMRAIHALAALTGNIGKKGSGVHFAQDQSLIFKQQITKYKPKGAKEVTYRPLDINNFAAELINAQDPPVKLLWISCRNLLTQNPDRSLLLQALQSVEMIVTVDLFLTPTAALSDIVLPTTTPFEEWDVITSYWHPWVSINQPAIAPYYESKSDLQIAQLLAQQLNSQIPGFCTFPTDKTPEQWISEEFDEELLAKLGISHWKELLQGPKRLEQPRTAWEDLHFPTPSGKIELYSERAKENHLPPLAMSLETDRTQEHGGQPLNPYPYRLLVVHERDQLNSQFQNLPSLHSSHPEPYLLLHPRLAQKKGIAPGDRVRIYNQKGELILKTQLSSTVEEQTIQIIHARQLPINSLITFIPTDMGHKVTGAHGIALSDTFVALARL